MKLQRQIAHVAILAMLLTMAACTRKPDADASAAAAAANSEDSEATGGDRVKPAAGQTGSTETDPATTTPPAQEPAPAN